MLAEVTKGLIQGSHALIKGAVSWKRNRGTDVPMVRTIHMVRGAMELVFTFGAQYAGHRVSCWFHIFSTGGGRLAPKNPGDPSESQQHRYGQLSVNTYKLVSYNGVCKIGCWYQVNCQQYARSFLDVL